MLQTVDLKIPPRPEYISVARLTAAAVAARQSFAYDEIEDLKVAVSEACSLLIGSLRRFEEPIALQFIEESEALHVRVEAPASGSGAGSRATFPDLRTPGRGGTEPAADVRALGVFLMQCLVDEVHRIDGDGGIALRLRKKQRENTNGTPPPTR